MNIQKVGGVTVATRPDGIEGDSICLFSIAHLHLFLVGGMISTFAMLIFFYYDAKKVRRGKK